MFWGKRLSKAGGFGLRPTRRATILGMISFGLIGSFLKKPVQPQAGVWVLKAGDR